MKRLMCAILSCCLVMGFTGCGSDEPQSEKAMGRYIETPISENLDGAMQSYNLHKTEDGAVFYSGLYPDDPEKLLRQSIENDTLTSQPVNWNKTMSDMGLLLTDIAESNEETVYLLATGSEGAQIFKTSLNSSELVPIAISDWPQTTSPSGIYVSGDISSFSDVTFIESENQPKNAVPNSIYAVSDGFLLIYQDQIEYRDSNGKKKKSLDGFSFLSPTDISVSGSSLFIKNRDLGSVQCYDLTSGNVIRENSFEENDLFSYLFSDDQFIYLTNSSGIYKQSYDASLWEKVVDGELTSLSIPSQAVKSCISDGNGGFYTIFTGDNGLNLVHYTYSADTPSQPDTELNIFSLEDHTILRQTIGEFQRKNPNVKVNLQLGLSSDESNVTAEDVIRTLNTEILNGKGPDLIVLDGLPFHSYVDKGILINLNDYMDQISNGQILENLTSGYQIDGNLYAIPAQFTLPIFLSKDGGRNIQDLSSLVDSAKTEADNTPPYLLPSGNLDDESGEFLMDWFQRCGTNMIANNALDTNSLSNFFEQISQLYSIMKSYTSNENITMVTAAASSGSGAYELIDFGPNQLSHGEGLAYAMDMTGASNLQNLSSLASENSWKVTSLFNSNQFTPLVNVGILDSSEQKELAVSFMSALYGQDVQSVYLGAGLPVNQTAMQNVVKENLSDEDGNLYPMGQDFYTLCQSVDQAIIIDEALKTAVSAQAANVLNGTLSPDEAAQKVNEAIKLYLSE